MPSATFWVSFIKAVLIKIKAYKLKYISTPASCNNNSYSSFIYTATANKESVRQRENEKNIGCAFAERSI